MSELLQWMRALHSPEPGEVAKAERVLVQDGFSEAELALARRISDPDYRVRQAVAEHLPRLRGIDAAGWMLLLCRDEHPEVRLTAFSFLATTADPRLLAQVEALAHKDSDPRIRGLAERLAPAARFPERR